MKILNMLMESTEEDFKGLSTMAVSLLKKIGSSGEFDYDGASEKQQKAADELADMGFMSDSEGKLTPKGIRALDLAKGGSAATKEAKEKAEKGKNVKVDPKDLGKDDD